MKLLFLTFGSSLIPSSRTRVYQYLPFFERDGFCYKVIHNFNDVPYLLKNINNSISFKIRRQFLKKCAHLGFRLLINFFNICNVFYSVLQITKSVLLLIFSNYDVFFVQKVFLPISLLRFLKWRNKILIFDFDDAIYTQRGYFRNQKRFNRMIPLFDLVVLENDDSEEYVRSLSDVSILRITGPIDTDRYQSNGVRGSEFIYIGWIGSPSTQKYVYTISDAISSICKKFPNVVFETIGAGKLDIDNSRINQKDWLYLTEVENLQNFDIGIMPLSDDKWTKGKGGYKLLQYMALGIPCCASPVGINNKLVVEGVNGFLPNSTEEWIVRLSSLIENCDLRSEMGRNGRVIAEREYSFQSYYPLIRGKLISLVNDSQTSACVR